MSIMSPSEWNKLDHAELLILFGLFSEGFHKKE